MLFTLRFRLYDDKFLKSLIKKCCNNFIKRMCNVNKYNSYNINTKQIDKLHNDIIKNIQNKSLYIKLSITKEELCIVKLLLFILSYILDDKYILETNINNYNLKITMNNFYNDKLYNSEIFLTLDNTMFFINSNKIIKKIKNNITDNKFTYDRKKKYYMSKRYINSLNQNNSFKDQQICFNKFCNDLYCIKNKFHIYTKYLEYPDTYKKFSLKLFTTKIHPYFSPNSYYLTDKEEKYFMKYYNIIMYILHSKNNDRRLIDILYNDYSLYSSMIYKIENKLVISRHMLKYFDSKKYKKTFNIKLNLPLKNLLYNLLENRIVQFNKKNKEKFIKIIYIIDYYLRKITAHNNYKTKLIYKIII